MSWRVLTRAVAGASVAATVMALPAAIGVPTPGAVVLATRGVDAPLAATRAGRSAARRAVPVLPESAFTAVLAAAAVAPPAAVLDIAYARSSFGQRLDVYRPGGPGPHPVVLYLHGGGWIAGDKATPADVGMVASIVAHGYAVVSVNYRLAVEAVFPAQLDDVRAALAWVRAQGPANGLDPDRLGLFGVSAGAHLAALLGVIERTSVDAVVGWAPPVDLATVGPDLAARADCDGAWSDPDDPESFWAALVGGPVSAQPDRVAAADPIHHLAVGDPAALPPFLLSHGDRDCTVPLAQSERLAAALRAVTGRDDAAEVRVLPEAGHVRSFPRDAEMAADLAFLDRHLGRHLGR